MKIEKDVLGWRIEPDTNTEEAHLEFLMKALENEYGKAKETKAAAKRARISHSTEFSPTANSD